MDSKTERRINEILLSKYLYGDENVTCPEDLSKVRIDNFPLPSGLNKDYTSVLIQYPAGYGYYDENGMGTPIEELYIDPDLKYVRNGVEIDIDNYFGDRTSNSNNFYLLGKGWRWICIKSLKGKWARKQNITTLLQQLHIMLSDPSRPK